MQSLDLYLPKRAARVRPTPIVVWVHGGAFSVGDKANQRRRQGPAVHAVEGGRSRASTTASPATHGRARPAGRYPAQPRGPRARARIPPRARRRVPPPPQRRRCCSATRPGRSSSRCSAPTRRFVRTVGVPPESVRCTVPLDTDGFDIRAQVAPGGFRERMFRNAFGDDPADVGRGVADPARGDETAARRLPDVHTRSPRPRAGQRRVPRRAPHRGGATPTSVRAHPLTHAQVNEAVGKPGDTHRHAAADAVPPRLRLTRRVDCTSSGSVMIATSAGPSWAMRSVSASSSSSVGVHRGSRARRRAPRRRRSPGCADRSARRRTRRRAAPW